MKFDTVKRFLGEYVSKTDVPHMSASELHGRLGEPGLHVLDCNLEAMWQRGHVPGAVYIGWDSLPLDLLPADKDANLVFYCGDKL